MKHIVHTDNEKYVVGLELTTSDEGVEVPEEVFNSSNQTCYKYENGIFTFDEEKLKAMEHQKEVDEEIADLKKKLADTDYIHDVILEGDATTEDYAEVIANRKSWRARVRELEK